MNELLRKMSDHISKEQKLSFISAFMIGIIVHLFMLSNKIPNHDDVGQLYSSMIRYKSGRWFLFFPAKISSDLSLPWFNGVLGIIYLSLSAMIIIWLFQVKSSICVIAISALMVTFPTVASTFNYMQVADAFFFSLLLACVAVCFVRSSSKWCWFVAIICLTLSMGIYQSYFTFAVVLLVIWHINELLIEDKDVKEVLLSGIRCICVIGVSVAAYLVITKLVLRYYNAELFGHTAGFVIDDFSIKNILRLILKAYKRSLGFYLINDLNLHYRYMNCLYILVVIISIVFSALLYKRYDRQQNKTKKLLLVFLYAVLPLAAGLIYCMCAQVHLLMVYGFVALALFPILLTDWIEQGNITIEGIKGELIRLGQITIVLIIFITSFKYALVSNKAYLSLYLTYEQSYAYANRLMTEIQLQDEYAKDDTIILIGEPIVNTGYTMPWREEKDVKSMHGVSATLINLYDLGQCKFLRSYLGVEQEVLAITSLEQLKELEMDIDINELNYYPNTGSIIRKEGVIFVKFSDVQ